MNERSYSYSSSSDAPLQPLLHIADTVAEHPLNLLDAMKRTDNLQNGKADADQPVVDKSAGPTNVVQELTALLKFLPDGQNISPELVLKLLPESGVSGSLQQLLTGATAIVRHGDHVELQRSSPLRVPIGNSIMDGNASVDALTFGNIAFDLGTDGQSIKNIKGVTVSVSALGGSKDVAITDLMSAQSSNGNPAVTAQIENPLPAGARDVLQMPAQLPLTFESRDGKFTIPSNSDIFYSLANRSGQTLPGMLLKDTMANAGDIALFAEQHPKWMHDVISPMFEELKKRANSPTPRHTADAPARQFAAVEAKAPDGATDKIPDKISKGGDYDQTIKVDGEDRHYLLHVPPNYDGNKPVPVLLMLHGRGQDGKDFANRSHMNDKADKEGFAVVYPDAEKWLGIKQLSAWDAHNGLVPPGDHVDDVGFLRSIIDKTQSQLSVDPNRIYMAGLSSGGMMTYLAATELSDKLAAVAVVSGAMSGKEPKPKSPLSVISTHGTNDPIIPIDGLSGVPPILAEAGIPTFKTPGFATEFWKRQDGITEEGTTETNGDITRRHFVNKSNGVAVDELTLKGSEHVPDMKLGVLDEVWKFLEAHPKVSGEVAPSQDPEKLLDNEPHPLKRILDDIKRRGADGIATDVGSIYQHSSSLPDGSIYPAAILGKIEDKTGVRLTQPVTDFIRGTTEISKNGNHVQFQNTNPTEFAINSSFGLGSVKSLTVNNLGFDLDKLNSHPRLSHIKGLTVNLNALGQDLSTDLTDLSDRVDAQGHHTYRLELDNPLPGALKTIMMASDKVNVGLTVNNDGLVKVANEKEIKNDLLGVNPITRGFIDEANDFTQFAHRPSLAGGLRLARDIGITAGLTYFTGRLRPLAATVGFLAAPAVVHFLDNL